MKNCEQGFFLVLINDQRTLVLTYFCIKDDYFSNFTNSDDISISDFMQHAKFCQSSALLLM